MNRLLSGLLCVLLTGLAACGEQDPQPAAKPAPSPAAAQSSASPSAGDPVPQQIRTQAIDPLFAAIRTSDAQALKELVHPDGADGLETSVGKLVSGFEAMQVKDLEVTTGNTAGEAAKDARTVKANGSYAIADIRTRFEFGGTFSFRKSSSRWKLAEISWRGTPVWRVPGPLTRTVGDGAVVFHPPDFPGSEVAGFAAAGLDRLGQLGAAEGSPISSW